MEWNAYGYLEASKRRNDKLLQEINQNFINISESCQYYPCLSLCSPSLFHPLRPLLLPLPPAKEDIKSEVLLSPFKEKPFTGRGELFSVLTYTPWTRARLRALAKGFPDPSQGPLGCREYELAIQTPESGFADMYPVIQLFLSESKARQWIEKAEWKQPLTNFDFRVNYSFIPEFFPKAIA